MNLRERSTRAVAKRHRGGLLLSSSLVAAGLLAGCAGGTGEVPVAEAASVEAASVKGETASPPGDRAWMKRVQLAREIAWEIDARPDDVDGVLARHGFTLEGFEQLLYEIASDPEMSRAYSAGLR